MTRHQGSLSPAVGLRPVFVDDGDIPVASGKLGGHPDVSVGFEWPTWRGAHLSFLAQLDLAELGCFPCCAALPRTGLLSFFYVDTMWMDEEIVAAGFQPSDLGAWRVIYTEGASKVQRCTAPDEVATVYKSARVSTLPVDTVLPSPEVIHENDEWGGHQVLGHPNQLQNDMARECQLVSNGVDLSVTGEHDTERAHALLPGSRDWQLLLQLDSDDGAQMVWGTYGRIYFWIRREDLAAKRFERVWMILQCT